MKSERPVARQLALNLRLRDASSFDNFLPGRNREALARLQALVARDPASGGSETSLFLWGEGGCGKTHLLEAACRAAHGNGLGVAYVPLGEHRRLTPEVLENLESAALVCVDDVERIAGSRAWEAGLFALYERLRARSGMLLAAAGASPAALGLGMPELSTRLAAGWVYAVHALNDQEKLEALRRRAHARGLDLPEEVARYVLARFPRDPHALFALLERIDSAALAAQRRLTIPFIRDLL